MRLKEGINPRAVFLAVTSASTNRWLERFSVGTTMPNLNASTIKKIPLQLPQSPTLAAILDNLERSIDSSKRVKEHRHALVNLRRMLVEDMVMKGLAHV